MNKKIFFISILLFCNLPSDSTELRWPIYESPIISQEFGCQECVNPNKVSDRYKNEGFNYHTGLDITTENGNRKTKIFAVEDGKISSITRYNNSSGYGNTIIINHSEEYYSLYAHLDEFVENLGDYVQEGDHIGFMGNSTDVQEDPDMGIHLHFEIRKFPDLVLMLENKKKFYGYTDESPSDFGYLDPLDYLLPYEEFSDPKLAIITNEGDGANIRNLPLDVSKVINKAIEGTKYQVLGESNNTSNLDTPLGWYKIKNSKNNKFEQSFTEDGFSWTGFTDTVWMAKGKNENNPWIRITSIEVGQGASTTYIQNLFVEHYNRHGNLGAPIDIVQKNGDYEFQEFKRGQDERSLLFYNPYIEPNLFLIDEKILDEYDKIARNDNDEYDIEKIGPPVNNRTQAYGSPYGTTGSYQLFARHTDPGNETAIEYIESSLRSEIVDKAFTILPGIYNEFKNIDYSRSKLGFPIANETDWYGHKRQDFENGYILWESNGKGGYSLFNSGQQTQNYILKRGINLISFPFQPEQPYLKDVIQDGFNHIFDYVFFYDNRLVQYIPKENLFIKPQVGYFVYADQDVTFTAKGNAIGTTFSFSQDINLFGVANESKLVFSSNLFSNVFYIDNGLKYLNPFDKFLNPGIGYIAKTNAPLAEHIDNTKIASIREPNIQKWNNEKPTIFKPLNSPTQANIDAMTLTINQNGTPNEVILTLGFASNATDSWDEGIDEISGLLLPGQLHAYFDESFQLKKSYKNREISKEWPITILSPSQDFDGSTNLNPITLTWTFPSLDSALNQAGILQLINTQTNQIYDLKKLSNISLATMSPGQKLDLILHYKENASTYKTPTPSPTSLQVNPTATNTPLPIENTITPTPTMITFPTAVPLSEKIIELTNLTESAKPLSMTLIPNGSYWMGNKEEDILFEYEIDRHYVTLTDDFYIGKYEITQAQWKAVLRYNPAFDYQEGYYGLGENLPAYRMRWIDCARFCNELSRIDGRDPVYNENTWQSDLSHNGFRLPTEAEWEYACRAGSDTKYYWGDDFDEDIVRQYEWYKDNTDYKFLEVGQKLSNPWGLFDIAGSVSEFTHDLYPRNPTEPVTNPIGIESTERGIRGGNKYVKEQLMRSASSGSQKIDFIGTYGLRIVLPGKYRDVIKPISTPELIPTPTPESTATLQPTATPSLTPTSSPIPSLTPVPTSSPTPVKINSNAPIITKLSILPEHGLKEEQVAISVGQSVTLEVRAEDNDGDLMLIFINDTQHETAYFVNDGVGVIYTKYIFQGSENNLGENTFKVVVKDNGSPSLSVEDTIKIVVKQYDDLIIAQGYGGTTHLTVRNMNPYIDANNDGIINSNDVAAIHTSFNAMPAAFEANVGGGTDRSVNLAVGDVNNDGQDELITTFGPITSPANNNSSNMVIIRSSTGEPFLPPFGDVFPDQPGSDSRILYPTGELHAAVGDFTGSGTKQIAFAQGTGSTGALRVFEWNGGLDFTSGSANYNIVAQLANQDELDTDSGWIMNDDLVTSNNGAGYSIAAGDLDQDGIDELIVGQNGPLGLIQVIDLGKPNPNVNNIILDASYSKVFDVFTALETFDGNTDGTPDIGEFRGDQGVNLAVADLNGDGTVEVVITSRGDSTGTASLRNWILITRPEVSDGQVTALNILRGGIQNAFTQPEGANPSNGLNIGIGEFSGLSSDGKEIIVGTKAIVNYVSIFPTVLKSATQSQYTVLKPLFAEDGSVIGIINLIIPYRAEGFSAFWGTYEPLSGEVSVAGF